ncbi:hypothetical protein LDA93_07695, partial [Enterococcus faecium]|nr:hypothetical protein [Enterococcus faecium]
MLKIVKRISLTSAIAAAVFMVIQVLADLYLPTLTSNIIDKGVAQGDVDYIWHTGFVMIGFSLISILAAIANTFFATRESQKLGKQLQSSPQSCVKVQPHQKHNVLRCEPNCH